MSRDEKQSVLYADGSPLETQGLKIGYDGQVLIREIQLHLQAGRLLSILGPNGSGKTTLLKTLMGYLQPVGGQVFLAGKNLEQWNPTERSQQMSALLTHRLRTDWMTCREVVETGRLPYTGTLGILSAEDKRLVQQVMTKLNLEELAPLDFMKVSDGQRQRVLIARALVQQPKILLLDEPTSFLDIRYQLELAELLQELAHKQGLSIILSIHEIPLARLISDDVLLIKGDQVVGYGAAQEWLQLEQLQSLYDIPAGRFPEGWAESLLGC